MGNSSDEELSEESNIEDDDTCTPFELEQYFQQKFSVHDEMAVILKKNYVLSLAKDDSFTRLVTGLSDGSVHLFDISSECGLSFPVSIAPPPSSDTTIRFSICGVRFVDETPNLLLVGTTNNLVRLFDLRTSDEVGRFQNNSENEAKFSTNPKKIVCFDRNSNSRVLCVGTEQHHNNGGCLLFYDLREQKELGGYIDSHQDDVTTLRFHPQNPDLLCSGSTDGLINIFDLQKPMEDDALLTTFNTLSSVHKVNWHKNVYNKDIISCITHTNDFKLYECEGDLIAEFERAKITENIKRKTVANCNLIDCHNMANESFFLLTGSNLNKGEIMRSLLVQNKQLLPGFDFQGNKQIVRESIFDMNSNVLITGGECGIVTLWTQQQATNMGSSNLKAKKKNSNKTTPY